MYVESGGTQEGRAVTTGRDADNKPRPSRGSEGATAQALYTTMRAAPTSALSGSGRKVAAMVLNQTAMCTPGS